MLDLRGQRLESDEREMLMHPLAGGVILFSRNYNDPQQLRLLCEEIHGLRSPPLLVAVDHEGGRVQRFHEHFTPLPPCRCYGDEYDVNPESGLRLCESAGWIMAKELLVSGVDFSFAPVLDLDRGISRVIGDRAFHGNEDISTMLAKKFINGMKTAGMAAVGKHFPGHGSVAEDSHHDTPVDKRRYEDIAMSDLIPFERLVAAGIPAIMPAHVIYPDVDDKPAGYSETWLQHVLRKQLGFQGMIFSDDINMGGAAYAGDYPGRARAALGAGCDMVLICNNQKAAADILDELETGPHPALQARVMRMHGRTCEQTLDELQSDEKWITVNRLIKSIERSPELALGDDEIKS